MQLTVGSLIFKDLEMLMFVSVVLLFVAPSVVQGDCPDFTFKCPTGESFTVGTCWKWSKFGCYTCSSIVAEMKNKCRKFKCGGTTARWYNRNDGCSSPVAAGAMTEVFRAACAIHDICYATPARTQSQCDSDFNHNMIQTCKFPGFGSIAFPVCASVAAIATIAVKEHGHIFPDFASTCIEV